MYREQNNFSPHLFQTKVLQNDLPKLVFWRYFESSNFVSNIWRPSFPTLILVFCLFDNCKKFIEYASFNIQNKIEKVRLNNRLYLNTFCFGNRFKWNKAQAVYKSI